jgi:hypothetical protein
LKPLSEVAAMTLIKEIDYGTPGIAIRKIGHADH